MGVVRVVRGVRGVRVVTVVIVRVVIVEIAVCREPTAAGSTAGNLCVAGTAAGGVVIVGWIVKTGTKGSIDTAAVMAAGGIVVKLAGTVVVAGCTAWGSWTAFGFVGVASGTVASAEPALGPAPARPAIGTAAGTDSAAAAAGIELLSLGG